MSTPSKTYTTKELIDLVIECRYGKDALAEVSFHSVKAEEGLQMYGKQAGKTIGYDTYSERRDSSVEIIRQALEAGTLTAYYFSILKEDKDRILKDEWKLPMHATWKSKDSDELGVPEPDSFADSYETLTTGTLRHGEDSKSYGQSVYVKTNKADAFLNTLTKNNPRRELISALVKIIKKDPELQAPQLVEISSIKTLARNSNISIEHIKKKLIPEARTLAGAVGKTRKAPPKNPVMFPPHTIFSQLTPFSPKKLKGTYPVLAPF